MISANKSPTDYEHRRTEKQAQLGDDMKHLPIPIVVVGSLLAHAQASPARVR